MDYALYVKIIEITPFTFHCGHKISEKMEVQYILNNLVAICGMCNLSMGSINYDEFYT